MFGMWFQLSSIESCFNNENLQSNLHLYENKNDFKTCLMKNSGSRVSNN